MYRIFIVEDDEIIANLLKKNLCSWGYDVSCAEDFSNIIQEFAHRDPQLVLLDLKLPFYNGFHWCEEIRRISHLYFLRCRQHEYGHGNEPWCRRFYCKTI